MARRRELDDEELGRLYAAMHRPHIELASSVGRFAPPFEHLTTARRGFTAESRFILDRVLAGDAEALRARDALITASSAILVIDGNHAAVDEAGQFVVDYLGRHRDEVHALERVHTPWTVVSDGAEGAWESDREFDRKLDDAVFTTLGEFGFGPKTRKTDKESWRCTSAILDARIAIEFDKGRFPGMVATGSLVVHGPVTFMRLIGDPFFFSGQPFAYSRAHHVERQFEWFFTEYARMFPHVLRASEEGLTAANAVLATLR